LKGVLAVTDQNQAGIIWGAKAIAAFIGRPVKSVFPQLEAGRIPGAKKIGGRWSMRPAVFLASFDDAAA